MYSEFCDNEDFGTEFGAAAVPAYHPPPPPPIGVIGRSFVNPVPQQSFAPGYGVGYGYRPGFANPHFDPHWEHHHHHHHQEGYNPNALTAQAAWQNLGPNGPQFDPTMPVDPTTVNAAAASAPDPSQASSVVSSSLDAINSAVNTATSAANAATQAAQSVASAASSDASGAIDAVTGASQDILDAGYEFGISHKMSHSSHHKHHHRQPYGGGGGDGAASSAGDSGDDGDSDVGFGYIPPPTPYSNVPGGSAGYSNYAHPQAQSAYPYSGPQTGHHHHHHHHRYGQGGQGGQGGQYNSQYNPNAMTAQAYSANYGDGDDGSGY